MKKLKLIHVQWRDASSHDSWQPLSHAQEPKDFLVETVGWLIGENKDAIVLGTGITHNGSTACTWTIPKGMIIKKDVIKGHNLSCD